MGTSCDVLQSLQLAQKVSNVELFVSHSSKCPSGKKLLALCHYLNLDLAIFSSFLACILGVILVLRAGSFFVLWHLGASASGSVWQCLLVADSGVRDDFCLWTFAVQQVTLVWQALHWPRQLATQACQALKAFVPAFVAHSEKNHFGWDVFFEALVHLCLEALVEVLLFVASFPICFGWETLSPCAAGNWLCTTPLWTASFIGLGSSLACDLVCS